jgi:hypothetical protein
MHIDVRVWWAFLSGVSVVNGLLWLMAARALRREQSPSQFHRRQLMLSAVYVGVCAFRSFLPRADVQRICLVDSAWSSVFVGRTVATVAELCFAAQWALFVHRIADIHRLRSARVIARCLVPMIAFAEIASWYAVAHTNFLGNVIEQSTWTLTGVLLSVTFAQVYPRACPELRRELTWKSPVIATFVWFMCTVDIPHYYTHWQADQRAGKRYLDLIDGISDSATRWVLTYEWSAWQDEVAWMALYFSVGVWMSISLSRACLCERDATA